MFGTLLNVGAIVVAGGLARTRLPELSPVAQKRLQLGLGAVALALGFHILWRAILSEPGHGLRTAGLALLAFALGRWTGGGLGLQRVVSRWSQPAGRRLAIPPEPAQRRDAGSAFTAAAALFCLNPLALLGPTLEALAGDSRVLGLKALLDALAAFSWTRAHGAGVLLGALPVLAFQGSLTLVLTGARPHLAAVGAEATVCAVGGLTLLPVALVMLSALRVRLADYLPALLWAALLALWVR